MTLILARHSTGEMLCDDSLDWGDIRFRACNKVTEAWGGLLGGAGTGGWVNRMLMDSQSYDMNAVAFELIQNYPRGHEDWTVEGLFLSPQGIWTIDPSGGYDQCDRDWCAIGSGAACAMAILSYTDGEAKLLDVLEAVADIVPSVSPRGKIWRLK